MVFSQSCQPKSGVFDNSAILFGFWGLLLVPALDSIGDNLFGRIEPLEALDHGRARFFEVFVMIEMELDLFDELSGQIFERLNSVAVIAVVGRNGDNLVVDFIAVDEFHNTKNTGFSIDAGGEGLIGDHEDVEFVAIFVESLRDEAIIGRLGKGHWFNAVEHKTSVFAVPLDFVVGTGWDFDNDVDFAIFVIARGEDFIKICHKNSLFIFLL